MRDLSKHDYSQGTVSNVSSTIINCKNTIENTVLSTESMSYSWDDIIHNVVTLFEIAEINTAKSELEQLFQKVDKKFERVVLKVKLADESEMLKIEESTTNVEDSLEIVKMLSNYLDKTVPVPKFK